MDNAEEAPGTHRAIQRAARRPGSRPRGEARQERPAAAPGRPRGSRESGACRPPHPGQAAARMASASGSPLPEGCPAVNEAGQDRQPSHPVCQRVVEHHDQGTRIVCESGNQRGRPQRLAGRQRIRHDSGRNSEEVPWSPGGGQRTSRKCPVMSNPGSSTHTGRPQPGGAGCAARDRPARVRRDRMSAGAWRSCPENGSA